MLADMAIQVEAAARSLVYDCASIADAGFDSDAAFSRGSRPRPRWQNALLATWR